MLSTSVDVAIDCWYAAWDAIRSVIWDVIWDGFSRGWDSCSDGFDRVIGVSVERREAKRDAAREELAIMKMIYTRIRIKNRGPAWMLRSAAKEDALWEAKKSKIALDASKSGTSPNGSQELTWRKVPLVFLGGVIVLGRTLFEDPLGPSPDRHNSKVLTWRVAVLVVLGILGGSALLVWLILADQ